MENNISSFIYREKGLYVELIEHGGKNVRQFVEFRVSINGDGVRLGRLHPFHKAIQIKQFI